MISAFSFGLKTVKEKGSETMYVALSSFDPDNFTVSDTLVTIAVGLLIVFSVLGIIFLCMQIMERAFSRKEAAAVDCPFDGVFDQTLAKGRVAQGAVVALVTDTNGRRNEIMSPAAGRIKYALKPGDRFKTGDAMFTIE
jgi:predicted deacylase